MSAFLGVRTYDDEPSSASPEGESWQIGNDESPAFRPEGIDKIKTVVVKIYGGNPGFDRNPSHGFYPGADGIRERAEKTCVQAI